MSASQRSLPRTGSISDKHDVLTDTDPRTGIVTREQWWKDGKMDRTSGAAFIRRHRETGVVTYEAWWKDGKRDRTDGPAIIERHAANGVINVEWWKGGERYEPASDIHEAWLLRERSAMASRPQPPARPALWLPGAIAPELAAG